MTRLLVLADDLTGTLDCAVQFTKQNIGASVCSYDSPGWEALLDGAEVLVMNTESRHVAPAEAAKRVYQAAEAAAKAGVRCFYKKIDSVLRGNIGSECEALLAAGGHCRLYMLPAFPENRRTTLGGCQYYEGRLVTDSALGRDRFSLPLSADIPELLRLQGCRDQVRVVGRCEPMPEETGNREILVFDAVTGDDLKKRAKELGGLAQDWTAAGCAGFAEYIPEALPLSYCEPATPEDAPGVLLVSGSINPISTSQIEHCRLAGARVIYLDYRDIAAGEAKSSELAAEALAELDESGLAVLSTSASDGEELLGEKDSMCRYIASVASKVLEQNSSCAIVAFGGDTSLGIVDRLGAREIRPLCEIKPGIVCSTLVCRDGSERTFVTKSGGFGDRDTISDILSFLGLGHQAGAGSYMGREVI